MVNLRNISILALLIGVLAAGPVDSRETIAILGTGDMGDSFGPRLAELGYTVVYGSRHPDSEKVTALLHRTGHGATATNSVEAAQGADIVILALPWAPLEGLLGSLGDMQGKTIIDLTWPQSIVADDGYHQMTIKPSGAEVIQNWLPKAMVVKAFGTTGTNVIDNPDDAGGLVSIPIASDHREAKETTARLASELGLDPVDAGPLRMARNIEAMMELYMVPHLQGRDVGWEFYFRRSNYWQCHPYSGGEDVSSGLTEEDFENLARMPDAHEPPAPCPD